MNRSWQKIFRTLLPLFFVLAGQTALVLHQLDDALHLEESTCQVCVHAQASSPASQNELRVAITNIRVLRQAVVSQFHLPSSHHQNDPLIRAPPYLLS